MPTVSVTIMEGISGGLCLHSFGVFSPVLPSSAGAEEMNICPRRMPHDSWVSVKSHLYKVFIEFGRAVDFTNESLEGLPADRKSVV